jgi:hypothetical protein
MHVWVRPKPYIHKIWTKVSSITPHFLHSGLSCSSSRWRCCLRVLWPVSRSIIVLDWVLLKGITLVLAPRLGPEFNSRACLWVSPRLCHLAQCWLTNQRLGLFYMSHLETPRAGSGPKNPRLEPPLASSSVISFPRIPACPGTQYSPMHKAHSCH